MRTVAHFVVVTTVLTAVGSVMAAGETVEVRKQIAVADLPPAVKARIEKSAGKSRIDSVRSVTVNGVITAYTAELTTTDGKSEVKIAPGGALIETPTPQGSKAQNEDQLQRRLAGRAKISRLQAEAAALRAAPGGKIGAVELEETKGGLLYSVEVRARARPVRDVKIDAITGHIVRVETTDRHKLEDEKDDELSERKADEREEKD